MSLSSMTVGKRFAATSGVLLATFAAFATIVIIVFNTIEADVHLLSSDSLPGIYYSAMIQGDFLALRGDYLRRMEETDATNITKVEALIADDWTRINADMKSYDATISTDEDRQQFEKMRPELAAIQQGWEEKVRPLVLAGKLAEAYRVYMAEIAAPIISLRKDAEDMVDANKKAADTAIASSNRAATWGWWVTIGCAIIAPIFSALVSWYMIVALKAQLSRAVTELTEGAEQIAGAASQVSSSSQSLAQGSSEQAASLEETSASSEEINSMARKNTDNSRTMASLVAQSEEMFNKTNRQLESMVISMDEINQSSGKISKIIKVIDEIAFQTNILALNAAVEAARAGEAGMGFAVVADEVRNLAQRSAQAAKDTAALIEESIAKSNDGKSKVDEVAGAIRAITADSNKIKILVDEVTLGSEEQSRGFEQIAKAISQMEQVTQTTAANAEESAAAAEELNAQSETLKDIVASINAMVAGSANSKNSLRAGGRRTADNRASFVSSRIAAAPTGRPSQRPNPFRTPRLAEKNGKASGGTEEHDSFPLEAAFREF